MQFRRIPSAAAYGLAARAKRSDRPAWAIAALALLAAVAPLNDARATEVLVGEDFSSGVIDPSIFEAVGFATLSIDSTSDPGNNRLRVQTLSLSDGVRIKIPQNLPGDPTAKCFRIKQEIDKDEFVKRSTWAHRIGMDDDMGDTGGYALFATRPEWNRCLFRFSGFGLNAVYGFGAPPEPTKGANIKWTCADLKEVTFDWLPPEAGQTRQRIQMEVGSLTPGADCKFKTTKKSLIDHHPGQGQPPSAGAYRIKDYKITAEGEMPGFDPEHCF